jgi:hypothetical protein
MPSNPFVSIPCLGETGFKFSILTGDQPTALNLVDLVCVALTKLTVAQGDNSDPVIVESWRALDRSFQNGERAGYERGYKAGLAAANALSIGEDEIKRIAGGRR